MKKITVLTILVMSVAVTYAGKVSPSALKEADWILQKSATYSVNKKYSKSIPIIYLGYDKDGKVTQGVAMRSFKTYKTVTALISLKRVGDKIVVDTVDIPDIGKIKEMKKQEKVLSALRGMSGTVVWQEKANQQKIDAVTGATRYQKRIYLYMDKMSKALVKEMNSDPGWPRKPVVKMQDGK